MKLKKKLLLRFCVSLNKFFEQLISFAKYVKSFRFRLALQQSHSQLLTQMLMLLTVIIAVYCDDHVVLVRILCARSAECLECRSGWRAQKVQLNYLNLLQ